MPQQPSFPNLRRLILTITVGILTVLAGVCCLLVGVFLYKKVVNPLEFEQQQLGASLLIISVVTLLLIVLRWSLKKEIKRLPL